MRAAAVFMAATALLVHPAGAQNIAGQWGFKTGEYGDGCSQTGQMTLIQQADRSAQGGAAGGEVLYSCTFVTEERCTMSGYYARVLQTCSARRNGAQLLITSQVKEIAKQEPEAYGYEADNWALAIASSDLMTGSLLSAFRSWARFERREVPIS
ncbi:hypothetical protein GC169_07325 [bacterium]|nr:hypothetical protein [bacterium]